MLIMLVNANLQSANALKTAAKLYTAFNSNKWGLITSLAFDSTTHFAYRGKCATDKTVLAFVYLQLA